MPANVRLEEVIQAANQAQRAGLHTCLPGKVILFDPITTTVTVQPTVKNPVFDVESGERDTPEDPPVIPNVPVVYPRGGGYQVSFPLEPGDHVVLVFSELSTAQWRVSGDLSEPGDVRRHSLGYPFAIPGAFPLLDVLLAQNPVASPLTAGKLAIGQDGNPATTIRVDATSVELGGLLPVPLAIGPTTATALTAIATYVAALTAALAGNATYTLFQAAMVAPGAALAAALAAVIPTVPATITKGQ